MKRLLIYLVLFVSFTSNAQQLKYFRSAYFTIFGDYVGMYPVTESMTKNINHYRFEFDDNNKLVSIEYKDGRTGANIFSDELSAAGVKIEYDDEMMDIYPQFLDYNDELSAGDTYYHFDYSGNRVTEITEWDVYSEDDALPISTMSLTYNNKGVLTGIDMEGPYFYVLGYLDNIVHTEVRLNKNNQIVEALYYEDYDPEYEEDNYLSERMVFTYDNVGNQTSALNYYDEEELSTDSYVVKSFDKNGYNSGYVTYDKNGKRTDVFSMDWDDDGEEIMVLSGPCEERCTYDEFGNMLSRKWYLATASPYEDQFNVHETIWTVDLIKNVFTQKYFDAKHNPVAGEYGYHYSYFEKDVYGRVTFEKYFDEAGELMPSDFGVYCIRTEYDDDNYVYYETYFDENGNPMADNSGAYKYEFDYDDYSSNQRIYDLDGNMIGVDQNYFGYFERTLYTEDGASVQSIAFYDDYRSPTLSDEGMYHLLLYSYDNEGNITSEEYYDTELKPVNAMINGYSVSKITHKYNSNGYEIEKAHYDMEGKPTFDDQMIFMYKTSYDDRGNVTQMDRYNAEKGLLNSTLGYATAKYKYDSNNDKIEEAFYNDKGTLWGDADGVARYVYEYTNGKITKKKFFNTLDKPTMNPQGAYQVQMIYDNNVVSQILFLNKKGKKMNNAGGCHKVNLKHNAQSLLISIEYFNKKGKPAIYDLLASGISSHRTLYTYDEYGYLLKTEYYDLKGVLTDTVESEESVEEE